MNNNKMSNNCYAIKRLKRILERVPDDAQIFYERIEDKYFESHGWSTNEFESLLSFLPGHENDTAEYLDIENIWYNEEKNVILITSHF